MRERMIRMVLCLMLGAVWLSLSIPALAADKYWVGGSGWWDYSTNWNPSGQPKDGDSVYLTQSGSTDIKVYYYNTLYPNAVLNFLRIDATGAGTTIFNQLYSYPLASVNEYIGYGIAWGPDGTGTHIQSGGSNTISNNLYVGYKGSGTYKLSGTGSLSVGLDEIIGNYDPGSTFTQSGGTNTIARDLYIGRWVDGGGTYDLISGSLSAVSEYIGNYGTGDFTQNGGTNTITGNLQLGRFSGGSGTYDLSGTGSLSAVSEFIGNYGTGTFTQSGGTHTVSNQLSLGYNSDVNGTGSGTYDLSGGSLSANYEYIGRKGTGSFTQSGGTHTVTNDLILGNSSGSSGSYDLTSGSLSANRQYIGHYGTATFTQSGGSNTITTNLYIGNSSTGNGTYNLSGTGSLSADYEDIGVNGTGTFNQSGGTHTVSNDLILGNSSISSGTYNLSGGDLSADVESIGYYGTGTFTQSGGTNTVNTDLVLGSFSSGIGTYDLSGTGSLSANDELIGVYGTGSFSQSGGDNTISNTLQLGYFNSGSGTYNLSDGTLSASSEFIGREGTGTFTQDGGDNTINSYLYLGYSNGSSGSYDLSSGSLSAASEYVGYYGTGSFTQGGGSNSGNNLLVGFSAVSNGSYELNAGSLSSNNEWIGYYGTGTFTQSGGTHTVTNTLTLAANSGSSGTYNLQGGTLTAGTININDGGTFNQDGGTINGDMQNQGIFNYNGGTFNNRLFNQGVVNFNSDFTAGDGMENKATVSIDSGRTVTLNGSGLDNQGTLSLSGILQGSGPLVNTGYMYGIGTIGGSGGFVNNGLYVPGSGATLNNSGSNVNYGNLNLSSTGQWYLMGANFTNSGTLNLNSGLIAGTGSLDNSYGGSIVGQGTINTAFSNSGGVVVVEDGTTNIMPAFTNSGLIQLTSYTANLSGGTITNTGSIEGYGHIGNDIDNTGIIEPLGSTLTLSGNIQNLAGGLITATVGNKILVTQGMGSNAGVINLAGGTFDNNNFPLTNTGQISGYGVLRTGGLSNEGSITLSGGQTTVNGDVTNQSGRTIEVAYTPALFTGDIVNEGTFKTTDTTVVFSGSFTNNGSYISDPSSNYYTDLSVGSSGYLQGGVGDNFYVSGDFLNYSLQNSLWNTVDALLEFNTGSDTLHEFYIPSLDYGATYSGYNDNFSWGVLSLDSGNILYLYDSYPSDSGALYVGEILGLDISGFDVSNIYGNGLNIYYLSYLPQNSYLGGLTYNLQSGGQLIPVTPVVPEPGTLFLLGAGFLGLAGAGIRKRIRT